MHYHCFKTYRRRHEACPSCRAQWPENINDQPLVQVGEAAARGDDEVRRTRRQKSASMSDEDDDEEMDEESQAGTQSQPSQRSQPKRKGKGKASQRMDVDNDDEEEVAVKPERKTNSTRRSSRR
jgi:hypothetical protein